jgi:hypothetical protein
MIESGLLVIFAAQAQWFQFKGKQVLYKNIGYLHHAARGE